MLSKMTKKRSSTSSSLADEDESKGPVKGIAKKMMNLAGRKAGASPAYGMRQLGATAKDMAFVRKIFEWENPKLSAAATCGSCFMFFFHTFCPLWCFAVPVVCGGFFVNSEKMKMVEVFAAKAPAALKRHADLKKWRRAGPNHQHALLQPTARPVLREVAKVMPFLQTNVNQKLLKSVIFGIFSRLDEDGSGDVNSGELTTFMLEAMPNASPKARAAMGGDEHAVLKRVQKLVNDFDADKSGSIDKDEFAEIVLRSGCAEVVIQDELLRMLLNEVGMQCTKLPKKGSKYGFPNSKMRAHPTSLKLTAGEAESPSIVEGDSAKMVLCYTSRSGTEISIDVTAVRPTLKDESGIVISHTQLDLATDNVQTETLHVTVDKVLRGSLVELLCLYLKPIDSPLADSPPSSPTTLEHHGEETFDADHPDAAEDA